MKTVGEKANSNAFKHHSSQTFAMLMSGNEAFIALLICMIKSSARAQAKASRTHRLNGLCSKRKNAATEPSMKVAALELEKSSLVSSRAYLPDTPRRLNEQVPHY